MPYISPFLTPFFGSTASSPRGTSPPGLKMKFAASPPFFWPAELPPSPKVVNNGTHCCMVGKGLTPVDRSDLAATEEPAGHRRAVPRGCLGVFLCVVDV